MNRRFLMEIAVIAAVWLGLHGYLGARLIRGGIARWRAALGWTLLALIAAAPIGGLLAGSGHRLPEPIGWWIQAFSFCLFAASAFFIALTMARDVIVLPLVLRAARSARPEPRALGATRRALLGQACTGVFAATSVTLAAAGAAQARRAARTRTEVAIPGLARAFDGFRIVQISDLHAGYTIDPGYVAEIVAQVNALAPDLIALTGDIVDGDASALPALLAPLAHLRAAHGCALVTGNHEYYFDLDATLAALGEVGLAPLVNAHRLIERGGDALAIGGVCDQLGAESRPDHRIDLAAAFAGAPTNAPRILLAHRPVIEPATHAAGVALQLSGHLHGGQFFPVSLLVRALEPYVAGLYRIGALQLYVSRGTGYLNPLNRLGCPAEIAEIVLRAPA